LHGLWNILTKHQEQGGYSHHPETLRWKKKLKALYLRHNTLVREFKKRKYLHKTPLDEKLATGPAKQNILLNTLSEQKTCLKINLAIALRSKIFKQFFSFIFVIIYVLWKN